MGYAKHLGECMKYLILILMTIPIIAQDITNKLGGDTSNETYSITDSNDNALFQVRGDGRAGMGGVHSFGLLYLHNRSAFDQFSLVVIGEANNMAVVRADASGENSIGVHGTSNSNTGTGAGVYGYSNAATGAGVRGNGGPTGENFGGHFSSPSLNGVGVYGTGNKYGGHFKATSGGVGIYVESTSIAAMFGGDVGILGNATVADFLNLQDGSQTVNSNDTVSPTTSYMKLESASHITLNSATAIADGSGTGQILFVENWGATYSITIPNNANTRLGSDVTIEPYQIIQLIWNGTDWVMPNIKEVT